jgi:radical SAM superfamily enzyme
MKHYTIPFFIPHKGCPHKCIFCDQKRITGEGMPDPAEVPGKIEKYLSTMPSEGAHIEVGFFGGSFTGLPLKKQEEFLKPARGFLEEGRIKGIRLSTRPDLIDRKITSFLKSSGVTCIELGVQSMSGKVLAAVKRGHTAEDTQRASCMILQEGFELGHQMMLGLSLSGFDEEFYTARRIWQLGARQARIYPVIVIKGTELADLWMKGEYRPLEEGEALERAAELIAYFEPRNIKVIRCGLHPSEGLLSGEEYLAGPFHPAFGQKARDQACRVSPNRTSPTIVHDKRLPVEYKEALRNKFPHAVLHPFEGRGEVYGSISCHPDIYLFQLDEKTVIHAPGLPGEDIHALKRAGLNLIKAAENPGGVYPGTARHNAAKVGKIVFHNLKHTDPVILEKASEKGLKGVHVNQGYANCSVMAIGEEALITSDASMAKKACAEGLDALHISKGTILLPGEKCGFLGGASGRMPDGTILILGDIDNHPDAPEIKAFMAKHNAGYIDLKGLPLYDAGGLFIFS